MIVNSLKNLKTYVGVYPFISEVITFVEANDLSKLELNGRSDISDNFYLVPIKAQQDAGESDILEVHKKWLDIHCTLEGNDEIIFRDLNTCNQIERAYDEDGDYALYKESRQGQLTVQPGYFCLIAPDTAHMALKGSGEVKKIVMKVKIR